MRIEFADLGDWGKAQLFSEYDPEGPVIRINSRIADALPAAERDEFVKRAIAHELYHHAEHLGEIPVIADRAERERAAHCHGEVSGCHGEVSGCHGEVSNHRE